MSKKAFSFVLILMLCIGITSPALAADGDFTIENGILTRYNGSGGNVVIPNGVTGIGDWAFLNCRDLLSVTIPDSVTTVGMEAFRGCSSLKSVSLPDGVTDVGAYAFWNCTSLTNIDLPSGLSRIRSCLFRNCSSLLSMNIPNSVTSIGLGAFLSCRNLTSVTIPASVVNIGQGVFSDCVSLSDIYYSGNEKEWGDILIGGDIVQGEGYLFDVEDFHDLDIALDYNDFEIFEIEKIAMSKTDPITSANIHYGGAVSTESTVSVIVNGATVAWTDAAPFVDENSRTMVPLRAVADALGLSVDWNGMAREASFSNGTKTIIFPISSTTARTSSGGMVTMDTAAVIVNDRTYAPIRYLAEYFGYSVTWDGGSRTVMIG